MPAYMILQIDVTDRERFREYSKAVVPLISEFGGKQIVRGAQVEVLEGTHKGGVVAVFEFPTLDAIHAFWISPKYAPVKVMRQGAAELEVWAVAGV